MKTETKVFIIDKPNNKIFRKVIKNLFYTIINLFLKVLFCVINKNSIECKYSLSMCSIFKNEGSYLKEWIEYHLLVGFEHFYLFNNGSDDNFQEVLQPYIYNGVVTLIDWPMQCGQVPSYEFFYKNYRNETKWVTFFDLDEFLCPFKEVDVKCWLNKFEKYPSVVIYWRMFGTSGVIDHDNDKLVIEQYTHAQYKWVNLGKVIYNTHYDIFIFEKGMMHELKVKWHGLLIPPVNEAGNFCIWNINRINKSQFSIQLNHYWSKSYNNYINKFNKGSAVTGVMWKNMEVFLNIEHNCTAQDTTIHRFLVETKLRHKSL